MTLLSGRVLFEDNLSSRESISSYFGTVVTSPFGTMQYAETLPLRDHEVVLTFDDGPLPRYSNQVLDILAAQCVKATFFEIGKHASWHPEITKQVIEAGMTVGTHTWSHQDLARNPYAKDIEQAKAEIEMGISAVHMAAGGGKVAPFFRFPALQHPPQLLSYLAERNIGVFSTDIDFTRPTRACAGGSSRGCAAAWCCGGRAWGL